MAAAGMVMVGSLGIQTSSSLSASLFGALGPIPVSSMRMLVAAIVILALTRPKLAGRSKGEWLGIVVYGLAMAAMNVCLYSAIDRIPMGVAVTLEFLGPCVVALAGSHHWREGLCAVVALVGVGLISFTPGGYFNPAGYLFALGSAVCFGLYTLFADRVGKAAPGSTGSPCRSRLRRWPLRRYPSLARRMCRPPSGASSQPRRCWELRFPTRWTRCPGVSRRRAWSARCSPSTPP